jgi:peroxiredoxin
MTWIAALTGAVALATIVAADLGAGTRAPDFTLPTTTGGSLTLSTYFRNPAKVVVLNLWATPSIPCRAQVPYLVELNKNYTGRGVAIVSIALDMTKSKVRLFMRANSIEYPVALDPKAEKLRDSYKVQSVPVTYVIDKKGIIRYVHSGFPSNPDGQKKMTATIETEVKKLVAEQ